MHAEGQRDLTAGLVTEVMRHVVPTRTAHGAKVSVKQFAGNVITDGEPVTNVAEPEAKFAGNAPVVLPAALIQGMQLKYEQKR